MLFSNCRQDGIFIDVVKIPGALDAQQKQLFV